MRSLQLTLLGCFGCCCWLMIEACGGGGTSGSIPEVTADASAASGDASGAGSVDGNAGDGGGGGGGVVLTDWSTRCRTVVDHNASCGKSKRDQAAFDECVGTQQCAPSAWSAAVMNSSMSCLATLPCNRPDDECISTTLAQQTSTKLALLQACKDKSASCSNVCLETQFLVSDDLALKLRACLDKTCDAAKACMSDEYAKALVAAGCKGELPFGG